MFIVMKPGKKICLMSAALRVKDRTEEGRSVSLGATDKGQATPTTDRCGLAARWYFLTRVSTRGQPSGLMSVSLYWAKFDECSSVMDSLSGQLLIATPALLDPNFARTVVLIAAHGDEGALGLILNRELAMRLPQVWEQVSQSPCLRDEGVRHGGPVSGTLMAVHDQRPLANLVISDDLCVATELSAMEVLAASDEGRAVFFVGHSGWARPARIGARRGIMDLTAIPARTRFREPRLAHLLERRHYRSGTPPGSFGHSAAAHSRRSTAQLR